MTTLHSLPDPPSPDEPAVLHPGLQQLVDAARAQPAPQVTLDAETLHAAWLDARRRRRSRIATLTVAAAVVLGVIGLAPALLDSPSPAPPGERGDTIVNATEPSQRSASPSPSSPSAEEAGTEPAPVRLAEGIEVTPLVEVDAEVKILDPHRLALPEGRWSIDSHRPEPVEIQLPDGALELRGGYVHVEVAAEVARAEVLRDTVIRIDREGRRSTLTATPPLDVDAPAPRDRPTADELASAAEAHLIAGERGKAIASLRTLVTTYPRSAPAQTGLIDLGRLLERAGRTDEARCAYQLFSKRWPGHALSGDISRAAAALGEGPTCKGLRPHR